MPASTCLAASATPDMHRLHVSPPQELAHQFTWTRLNKKSTHPFANLHASSTTAKDLTRKALGGFGCLLDVLVFYALHHDGSRVLSPDRLQEVLAHVVRKHAVALLELRQLKRHLHQRCFEGVTAHAKRPFRTETAGDWGRCKNAPRKWLYTGIGSERGIRYRQGALCLRGSNGTRV